MEKIRAAITGIHAWVPEYRLTNQELSKMVDTSDEWIMQRVGIKERRILKEEGLGSSDMGEQAVRGLLEKTNTSPEEIDLLICTTVTPDMVFPATANVISDKVGIKNAFTGRESPHILPGCGRSGGRPAGVPGDGRQPRRSLALADFRSRRAG